MTATIWANKYGVDYSRIPEHCQKGMRDYIEHGTEPSGFLYALLTNDLAETIRCADDTNIDRIADYVRFLCWEVPAKCWGSAEKVEAWINRSK